MSEFKNLLSKKAAALKYDPDQNGAPVVVASGMGYMAERITETAMQAGVPIYEDDSLATLLTQLELGAEIPEELYQAVVEIYLYFLGFTGDQVSGEASANQAGAGNPLYQTNSAGMAGAGDPAAQTGAENPAGQPGPMGTGSPAMTGREERR